MEPIILKDKRMLIPQQPSKERAEKLLKRFLKSAKNEYPVDVLSASFGLAMHIVIGFSDNKANALANVDLLTADLKKRIAEKMGE